MLDGLDFPTTAAAPRQLSALAQSLDADPGDTSARAEFWKILNALLYIRLRSASAKLGPLSREDTFDLCAEKSLELMTQFDAGQWRPQTDVATVSGFLATVARNGLIDHLRMQERHKTTSTDDAEAVADVAGVFAPAGTSPDVSTSRHEFVEALVACADGLKPRDRSVWLFRVFLDMSTRSIAEHPEVTMTAGNIDVVLRRCRENMRECMLAKEFDVSEMPHGTLVALWKAFRIESILPPGAEAS